MKCDLNYQDILWLRIIIGPSLTIVIKMHEHARAGESCVEAILVHVKHDRSLYRVKQVYSSSVSSTSYLTHKGGIISVRLNDNM